MTEKEIEYNKLAAELRIGNFVFDNKAKELVAVFSLVDAPHSGLGGGFRERYVNRGDVWEGEWDYSETDVSAIPLTEEWLLKFGFEKKVKNTGAPIWENLESFSLDGYEFSEDSHGEWFLCGYNWNTKHFKYVHQLQNLYFALTGEELKLISQPAPSGDKSAV